METIRTLASAGLYGNLGLYGLASRIFFAFALFSLPTCLLIDAPFGRAVSKSILLLNGDQGWLFMEIVSPLTFIYALSTPLTSTKTLDISTLFDSFLFTLSNLPKARALLALLFVTHYINRSIVSTFRNPGRGLMHISVFLSAVTFNLINGFLMGTTISSGGDYAGLSGANGWGIKDGSEILFALGILLFLGGLTGNIISDEILYSLRRNKPKVPSSAPVDQRYSIPHGFLYDFPFGGIAFPNYFTEWIEWTGFLLCTLALNPGFPNVVGSSQLSWIMSELPAGLRPFEQVYLQPMGLFLLNLIAAMLPRAISGQRWYRKNFKEYPTKRKIVIPGLF